MKEHKHYPVSGCGLARMWKLRFAWLWLIDWETRTSRCHECAALIRVPKALNIVGYFYPVSVIPPTFLCFRPIYNSNLPEFLQMAIGTMMLVFFKMLSEVLFGSLVMAFGRWELEQDVEDVKQRLRKEGRLKNKQLSGKWRIAISLITIIITMWNVVHHRLLG